MGDVLRSIIDFDLKKISNERKYYPSPEHWEDQAMYFLLVDRYSNGLETSENLLDITKDIDSILEDGKAEEWNQYGSKWNGGNLKGIISKLDYLKDLGITAIWISPILKQTTFSETYHGYATQDFLNVDPHFGTREDLKQLVEEAHNREIRVIMDVVLNHMGDVFTYEAGSPIWTGEEYKTIGLRNSYGNDVIPFEKDESYYPDSSIWPIELQTLDTFERKGRIMNWDRYPEYIEGDFYGLKAINLGRGGIGDFKASEALKVLTEVYKYWIAYADIDGFRIDTVKHMSLGATACFVNAIRDFTYTLGKKNFYLIGEIVGGVDFAYDTLNKSGLDAAVGINNIPENLENVAKGIVNPMAYFSVFSNHEFLGEQQHLWYRDNVITMFDDHDMVTKSAGYKYRFCAQTEMAPLLSNAFFLNVMTLGIPCIYYGTEQGFDGSGGGEIYVRESMFGGKFGAFRSQNKHCFNPNNKNYIDLKNMLQVRKEYPILRQGRQYLREISGTGEQFGNPHKLGEGRIESIIAWSRIFDNEEMILAMNTNVNKELSAYISLDQDMHNEGDCFECIYSSAQSVIGQSYCVERINNRIAIKIEVEKHSCSIFSKK